MLDLGEYVNQIDGANSDIVLFEKFADAVEQLGYRRTLFRAIVDQREQLAGFEKHAGASAATNVSRETSCNPVDANDSVTGSAYSTSGPFFFSNSDTGKTGLEIASVNSDVGDSPDPVAGICIPLRGTGGSFAVVKATEPAEQRNFCKSVLHFANAVANIFYSKFSTLENTSPPVVLTSKEHYVLQLVAKGGTKSNIAESMGVTVHAVDFHFRNILKKYETNRIVVAVAKAVRSGAV